MLLVINTLTSFIAMMTCWWLAHVLASGPKKVDRVFAFMVGALGFYFALSAGFWAFSEAGGGVVAPLGKVLLTAVLVALGRKVLAERGRVHD